MNVVLDANVLGPGLLAEHGVLFDVLECWRTRRFSLIISDHLFTELATTLEKSYWRARFPPDRIRRSLILVQRSARHVVPTPGISGIATHWQDDLVIATAIAGDAQYLVTGDKELLEIARYQSVEIIAPAEFLEILSTDTPEL